VIDQASTEKTDLLEQKPDITMIKRILILTVVIGLIAESSVFAADPTPAPSPEKGATTETAAPSPEKGATTETASPSPSPEKKTRRRARVEARRAGRQQRREGRQEARQTRREARGPEASPTPAAKPSPTPKQ
jgi:uncharacterized membrane protein